MKENKTKKAKKKIVLEVPDIEELKLSDIKEIDLSDMESPKVEDLDLPEIEDMEFPGLLSRGGLVLGLLKNLMPGLKITLKKESSWIQAFNKMGAAEISRIIALSHSEIYCRRAIEKSVKETEK